MFRRWSWLLILAVACAGCSSAAEPIVQAEAAEKEKSGEVAKEAEHDHSHEGHDHAHDHSKEADAEKNLEPRTNMEGRWLIAITNYKAGGEHGPAMELPGIMFDVNKGDDGKLHAKLHQYRSDFFPQGEIKFVSEEVTDNSAHLVSTLDGQPLFDIRADFADGIARGNMIYGRNSCDPVRFLPTVKDTLQGLEPKLLPGNEQLEKALESPEANSLLQKFRKEFPESPLAMAAYVRLIDEAKDQKLDRDAVLALAKDYYAWARQWGFRRELKARFDVAVLLTHRKYLLNDAISIYASLEKDLVDELTERWKPVVVAQKHTAEVYSAIEELGSSDENAKNKAAETLIATERKEPFNFEVTFALAQFNEKLGKTDEAMDRYARLTVTPLAEKMLQGSWQNEKLTNPLPSETVARLWKEKHGNTDGLDPFLDKRYADVLHGFGDEKVPPRGADGGNRVALVELFTGAECYPCIGADVAFSRVIAAYPPSDLIALMYQQHIPGPSPLSNDDADFRIGYYAPNPQERGTPTAAISGKVVQGLGMPLVEQSTMVYQALCKEIDSVLTAKTDLRLKLAAQASGSSIDISAEVEGIKDSSQSTRLRMVIAEDDVLYVGGNGIRHHEMLVRHMPGGPLGIAPTDGKLSFKKKLDMADIRQQLSDYLDAFEQRFEHRFPAKPLELKKLHFVAFVQDDMTHEILQAASIPVSGSLELPPLAAPAKPAAPPKQNAPQNGTATPQKEPENKNAPKEDAKK